MRNLFSDRGRRDFIEWLRKQGAEVLASTNAYELARFRARGGVHVIYKGRKGITAAGFSQDCIIAWQSEKRLGMGITKKPRSMGLRWRAGLAARDGLNCFYCWEPMPADDITIEHLVSRDKGGPDHMDNMVLAHEVCNQKAGNWPLIQKIRMHVEARRENV